MNNKEIKAFETITVNGIEGYVNLDNGETYLALEGVVRGLGYARRTRNGKEFIRWDDVDDLLYDLKVRKYEQDWFLPESLVYAIARKIDTIEAEEFAKKVRTKIVPTIRAVFVPKPKAPSLMTTTEVAEAFGVSAVALNLLLCTKRLQYRKRNEWQFYKDKDLVKKGYVKYRHGVRLWTSTGRRFLFDLLDLEKDILPLLKNDQ